MNPSSSDNIGLILLADDDVDDCMFFANAIDDLNLPVKLISVNNGEALMNWLCATETLPEIIFLDMNMPCKNGAECLAEIKNTERLANIPVIIISTSLDGNIIKSLHKMGALFFIKKPNLFSHLKFLIANVFTSVKAGIDSSSTLEKFVLTADNR